MEQIEFKVPDFVLDNDAETIQARMMERLPPDIDDMPGGFPYDFTMPTALEKSELIQFQLVQTLMLMFPQWAWSEFLDQHAQATGIIRRPAGRAAGTLSIRGMNNTVIPVGTIFATQAISTPALEYETTKTYVIGDEDSIDIEVVAVGAGVEYNVNSDMITTMSNPVTGIISITNLDPITGGTAEEDDEALRERILEACASSGLSFVGNNADYIRWAKEVPGVGDTVVIPIWNGPGTVKLVITDANGDPANEYLKDQVYEHIMSEADPLNRLAPIGAMLTVVGPEMFTISYSAKVYLEDGYSIEAVKAAFLSQLTKYYLIAKQEGAVMYNHAASFLYHTDGVRDFKDFKINGGSANIPMRPDIYPASEIQNFEVIT